MTLAEILSLIVAIFSLITSIVIFLAQRKQDKRVNMQLEERRKDDIENRVRKFIIDHNNDLIYIPFCYVANKYNKYYKYDRNIYNEYNYLSDEEREELLRQLNFNIKIINDNEWLDKTLNAIKTFINENKLGDDHLYDGAKLFKNALKFRDEEYDISREWKDYLCEDFFSQNNVYFENNQCFYNSISVADYFFEYYKRVVIQKDKLLLYNKKVIPPMDMLYLKKNLKECSDSENAYWMMNAVQAVVYIMLKKENYFDYEGLLSYDDSAICTYEDKFLSVLVDIYNLFNVCN